MTEIAWMTQTELELAVGGAAVLVQLLDKDADGVADTTLVNAILVRANAEVSAAVENQYALSAFSSPYPSLLINAAMGLGAYFAWTYGSSEVALPPGIERLYQDSLRLLDQISKRERSIGATPQPGTNQAVEQIDPDPNGDRVTRTSLRGFW